MSTSGHGEQQYSLRWNDYHTSILSSFRHLRDEEDFVDVTLACDGCSFTAHKVVLSACSPYFRRLLKANPCQHPIVILRDVKQRDMESLLRFMYNGEVHIGQEQLEDFIKTAQTLQVRGLADMSSKESHRLSASSEHRAWGQHLDSSGHRDDGLVTPPPTKRSRAERYSDSPALNSQSDHHRDSLLGQALEGGHQHHLNAQLQSGDDSSTNDSASDKLEGNNNIGRSRHGNGRSDRDDMVPKSEPSDYGEDLGEGMDHSGRNPYPAALLGLQGLAGLLPGPSGIHNSNQDSNFVSRRGLDMMRVRATDPRPCPKCGKIYRSAHTLRTHLEDKHTVCPGYRCVLCGTVAKSRNSLHSHMSRQHRGISTKDLPVVPMPAPFDPELASRLLAKAGVRVSAAELAARASPTGPRRSDLRLDLKNAGNDRGYSEHHHHHQSRHHSSSAAPSEGDRSSLCGDDPEDLSVPSRFDVLSPPNSNQQSVITKNKAAALMAAAASASGKSIDAIAQSLVGREAVAAAAMGNSSTGSAILDTYLQMMMEGAGSHLAALGLKDQQAALMAVTAARARAAAASENDKQRGGESHSHSHSRERERDRERERPPPPHLVPHEGDAGDTSQEEDDFSEDEEEAEAK